MTGARHELKYLISMQTAELLSRRLKMTMRPDPHAGEKGDYFVRSLYFDDIDYSAYRQKLDGVDRRKKLRLRFYNFDEGHIVLEKKEKIASLTRKSSVKVTKAQAEAIICGDRAGYAQAKHPLIREFDALASCGLLKPKVLVDYQRRPFIYATGNTRVTLDTNVTTAPFKTSFFDSQTAGFPALDEGQAILEVKFDDFLPPNIKCFISDIASVRIAVSKYCQCLQILE